MKITYVGDVKYAYLLKDVVKFFNDNNKEEVIWTNARNAGVATYYNKDTMEQIRFMPYMLKTGLKIISWTEKGDK